MGQDEGLLNIGELRNTQIRAKSLVYPENHDVPVYMSYDEHAKLSAQYQKDEQKIEELNESLEYMHEAYEVLQDFLETECEQKTEELFKEIKENFFTYDGDGNLILQSAMDGERRVKWYQSLGKNMER